MLSAMPVPGTGKSFRFCGTYELGSGKCSDKRLQWEYLGISAVLFKLCQQAGKLQLQCVALAAHPNMMSCDCYLAPCQALPSRRSQYSSVEDALTPCTPGGGVHYSHILFITTEGR